MAIAAASCVSAHGAALTVTPSNPQGWGQYDMRVNGAAAITNTYANNGNGSLQFNLTTSADKAGYAYQWNPTSTGNPFGVATKLSNITAFSYDWLRDSSSTSAAHLQPTVKLLTWNDADSSGTLTVGDTTGFLIYESIYNGGGAAVTTNVWQSQDVLGANLWQWSTGKGANENFDITISEWLAGQGQGHPNSSPLNANTYIYGIEGDVGSGWGQFTGAIDNVNVGFSGNDVTSNFEVVPEPSSAMLGIIGAVGLLRRKRR